MVIGTASLDLPNGPWNRVFSGVWANREIAYYQNPERVVMTLVYDRLGESVKGVVVMMARFFSTRGKAEGLVNSFQGNALLLEKNTPTFKGSFVGVVTDPSYVRFSPRELINEAQGQYEALQARASDLRRQADNFKLSIVDVQHASEDVLHELMGEPLALPSMIVRKAGPGTVSTVKAGEAHLGVDLNKKEVSEDVQNFLLSVVVGEDAKARRAVHVLLEGFVLNGVSAVVFDGDDRYARIETPNPDTTEFSEYGINVDPIGLPVRKFKPGFDMFIDLHLLDTESFADVTGIGSGKASELIGRALPRAKKLSDISVALDSVREEEVKYYAARGKRICTLLEMLYPGLFDGNVEPKEIVAPWLKKMGRVAIVNTKGLDDHVMKGVVFTVLKTLYENYKSEMSNRDMKVNVVVEGLAAIKRGGGGVDKQLNALFKLGGEFGVGVTVVAGHDLDVDEEIKLNSSARVTCLDANEATVETATHKIERFRFRPALSAM